MALTVAPFTTDLGERERATSEGLGRQRIEVGPKRGPEYNGPTHQNREAEVKHRI